MALSLFSIAASAHLPGWLMQLLTLLGIMLLLTGFAVVGARTLGGAISAYLAQSAAVTAIAAAVGIGTLRWDLLVIAGLTVIVKVILIPRMLRSVEESLPSQRERAPLLNTASSLIGALALTLLAFFTAPTVLLPGTYLNQPPLAISLALVLIGLFVLSVRRHVLAQVIGLLTIENGLFSGALAIVYGMPLLVEFGILFDVLVAVVVLTLLVSLLHRTTTSADTLDLRRLRG
jgi:hydrogenase-4 component E